MKYYEIYKNHPLEVVYAFPVFIVEKKEIAEDLCKRYPELYYKEIIIEESYYPNDGNWEFAIYREKIGG